MSKITKIFRRFVESGFGIGYIKRVISVKYNNYLILNKIKRSKSGPDFNYEISNRYELQSLLAGPALINDPEVKLLAKYARLAKGNIVEIGIAYGGSSLLFLLYKILGVKLFSIDPFVQDSMGKFQATQSKCFGFVSKALKNVGMGERLQDWNLIPDFSFNVIKDWKQDIDVIFIDGDHRYEEVKKDFIDWLPFVKKDGFILFHDSCRPDNLSHDGYDHGWPGPSKLVRELKSDSRVSLVEQVFSISVFKKNE